MIGAAVLRLVVTESQQEAERSLNSHSTEGLPVQTGMSPETAKLSLAQVSVSDVSDKLYWVILYIFTPHDKA